MVPEELSAPQKMGNDTETEMDPQLFLKSPTPVIHSSLHTIKSQICVIL